MFAQAGKAATAIGPKRRLAMKESREFCVVLVTCGNLLQSRMIAKTLVKKRLAACVTIVLGPVQSIYRWKKKVETAREHLLLVKTTKKRLAEMGKEVKRLHSYEVPEILALPVTAGSESYLAWLGGEE